MGKARPKKKFLGTNARSNPSSLIVATEDELEASSENVWQRISTQLQSGTFYNFWVILPLPEHDKIFFLLPLHLA